MAASLLAEQHHVFHINKAQDNVTIANYEITEGHGKMET